MVNRSIYRSMCLYIILFFILQDINFSVPVAFVNFCIVYFYLIFLRFHHLTSLSTSLVIRDDICPFALDCLSSIFYVNKYHLKIYMYICKSKCIYLFPLIYTYEHLCIRKLMLNGLLHEFHAFHTVACTWLNNAT